MTYWKIVLRFCAVAAASLGSLALPQGCTSSVEEQIDIAQLGEACLINSDCSERLVCAFELCHIECEASRDCEDGARCVAADRPYKVCQLEDERACQRTTDCPHGLVCAVDHECHDKCLTDVDCVQEQVCVTGVCADTHELDEAGQLAPTAGSSLGEEGSPCVYVSDCAEALLCRSQSCLPECKADKDCGAQQKCEQTRCVEDGSRPPSCTYSSDCTEPGKRCLGGRCLDMCVEERDCPLGEQCEGGACEPKPRPPGSCVYNSDCTKPGDICRSGRCDCECKKEADCADGLKCDGCGCYDERDVLDGIVRGTVQIGSALELAQYRGVIEIQGDLIIGGLNLSDLGDTFNALRSVHGSLKIQQAKKLERVSFPMLEEAAGIIISEDESLQEVRLKSLKSAIITVTQVGTLDTLALDALETGSVSLKGLAIAELRLPFARELSNLILRDNLALAIVDLPELATVHADFEVGSQQVGALHTLSAPLLSVLGSKDYTPAKLIIERTQLTTLEDLLKTPQLAHATSLQITSNALLSDCFVQALLKRCQAAGLKATPLTQGNSTCNNCNATDLTCCDPDACPE